MGLLPSVSPSPLLSFPRSGAPSSDILLESTILPLSFEPLLSTMANIFWILSMTWSIWLEGSSPTSSTEVASFASSDSPLDSSEASILASLFDKLSLSFAKTTDASTSKEPNADISSSSKACTVADSSSFFFCRRKSMASSVTPLPTFADTARLARSWTSRQECMAEVSERISITSSL